MDDLLGETVAEIGLWIGAEIRERQNHDRWFSELVVVGRGGSTWMEASRKTGV